MLNLNIKITVSFKSQNKKNVFLPPCPFCLWFSNKFAILIGPTYRQDPYKNAGVWKRWGNFRATAMVKVELTDFWRKKKCVTIRKRIIFKESALRPLLSSSHDVRMSVCVCVCVCPLPMQFFLRPLIVPLITWSDPGLSLVDPPPKKSPLLFFLLRNITQPLKNCIGSTIRIGREIFCPPYAGFFFVKTWI